VTAGLNQALGLNLRYNDGTTPRDNDTRSHQSMLNPCHGGCDNHEGCNLSLEGPGPKAFGDTVHDARFPRHFRASGNIIKYNGKTNPSVWLENCRLMCRAGGANDNLLII
jgi:hypothetical protein